MKSSWIVVTLATKSRCLKTLYPVLQLAAEEAKRQANYLSESAAILEAEAGALAAGANCRSRYNRTRGAGKLDVPHISVRPFT